MNKLKTILIGIIFLFGINILAKESKSSFILEELANFHDELVKETSGKFDSTKLIKLLEKGGDTKEDTETFKKAIPIAKKLSEAKNQKDKEEIYSQLVESISSVMVHQDKSKLNVFYCPMAKKKWIAKGEKIVNPYYKDMRDCGNKI